MLSFPKSEFTPHPAGQHQGTIYEVEIRLQEETPWGLKDKIILKIQSETPMLGEDGKQRTDSEGRPMFFNLWDFLTVTRKGKLASRREAILGRPLTPQDFPDDYDPETEFLNRKIGYVVKHTAGKEPNTVSAGIETLWPIGNAPTVDMSSAKSQSDASSTGDDDLPF